MKKKKTFLKGIIPILSLLLVGALSVLVACHTTPTQDEPTNQTETSSQYVSATDTNIITAEQKTTVSSLSESGSDTESVTNTGTVTDTEADISKDTQNTDTPQNPITITPPADGSKRIAFTFDDGPHWQYTKLIADEFQKYNGKCTYFVVGNRIHGTQGEALTYAASLGNEVGIHGYTHTLYFNECAEEDYLYELQMTHDLITRATQVSPVLMRPPGGNISTARVSACQYSVILWNVDPRDWFYKEKSSDTEAARQEKIDIIANHILNTVTEGDIILLHDIYSNTYEAVKQVLPILKEQGYEFVTVSELLEENRIPGKKYRYEYKNY